MVQLEELLAVRHSVFVIGNAGTGKSKILKTLYETHKSQERRPVWNDLNPKALTTDELFGFIHPATREWKDGEYLLNSSNPSLQLPRRTVLPLGRLNNVDGSELHSTNRAILIERHENRTECHVSGLKTEEWIPATNRLKICKNSCSTTYLSVELV